MAERNDIPVAGREYTADDDHQIREVFTIEGTQFKFIKVPSGNFVRKGDALYIDSEGAASTAFNASSTCNAIAKWNIDALAEDKYSLVVWLGGPVYVATPDTSVTSVYNGARLSSYINGQMRCANALMSVSNSNAQMIVPATSCTVGFQKTAASVFADYLAEGDLISTNAGVRAAVAAIINTNAIATTASTSVLAGAHVVSAYNAIGGAQKSRMTCSCANAYYELISVPSTGLFSGVNLSSQTTTLHANACVMGRIVKVGDIIKGPNSSTRLVTALVNAYAATINAAMDTETAGLAGSVWNVNARFITAIVG
jgi:hypothetical protein